MVHLEGIQPCNWHTVLPIAISCPVIFPESQWWLEISSLSKVILVLGKTKSHQIQAVGGWVTWVSWCFTKKICTRCDAWAGALSWWSCQPPVRSCLNHANSFCTEMFKLNAKFDADLLLYLLSHFECDSPPYTCSLNSIYCPHWLVQWSHHSSRMCIPVYSPWLRGYIDDAQTVLVILTMDRLFLDRPRIYAM